MPLPSQPNLTADKELCPFEDHRERSELIFSLVAAYAATATARGHPQHSLSGNKKPVEQRFAFSDDSRLSGSRPTDQHDSHPLCYVLCRAPVPHA
jgi:hypothetical protein